MTDFTMLPDNLPVPVDDGACMHLAGKFVPSVEVLATDGELINLSLVDGRTVLYAYPMMGSADIKMPENWDMIPGARGCTPQACDFRDHFQQLNQLGVSVFGISTQSSMMQQEAVKRLHLPFRLLSDATMAFTKALQLPTFTADSRTLIKRHTLVIKAGIVEHVFYPVFPPNQHAQQVIDWLENHAV
jgi:peroxiredoxin